MFIKEFCPTWMQILPSRLADNCCKCPRGRCRPFSAEFQHIKVTVANVSVRCRPFSAEFQHNQGNFYECSRGRRRPFSVYSNKTVLISACVM